MSSCYNFEIEKQRSNSTQAAGELDAAMFMPLQINLMRELLLLPVGISGRGNLLGRGGGGKGWEKRLILR